MWPRKEIVLVFERTIVQDLTNSFFPTIFCRPTTLSISIAPKAYPWRNKYLIEIRILSIISYYSGLSQDGAAQLFHPRGRLQQYTGSRQLPAQSKQQHYRIFQVPGYEYFISFCRRRTKNILKLFYLPFWSIACTRILRPKI
jgi:hypothetical protein